MTLRRTLLACLLPASATALAQEASLRTAVDSTFAPFAFPSLSGGVQSFSVDLFTEVARRMNRPIAIDSASYSGLIAALDGAPTTSSPRRRP